LPKGRGRAAPQHPQTQLVISKVEEGLLGCGWESPIPLAVLLKAPTYTLWLQIQHTPSQGNCILASGNNHVSCYLMHTLRIKYLAQPLPGFKLMI